MFRSCIICVLYFWTVFFCIVLHAVLWLNFTSDVFTVYSLYCLLHYSEMIVDEWFLFTFQQVITISLVIIKIIPSCYLKFAVRSVYMYTGLWWLIGFLFLWMWYICVIWNQETNVRISQENCVCQVFCEHLWHTVKPKCLGGWSLMGGGCLQELGP